MAYSALQRSGLIALYLERTVDDVKGILSRLPEIRYKRGSTRRITEEKGQRSVSLAVFEVPYGHKFYGTFREHDSVKVFRGEERDLVTVTLAHLRNVGINHLAHILVPRLNFSVLHPNDYKGCLYFPIKKEDDLDDVVVRESLPMQGPHWFVGRLSESDYYKSVLQFYELGYPFTMARSKEPVEERKD